MVLTLALSYGGRDELLAAAQRLAERAVRGGGPVSPVSVSDFEACLSTHGLPELDLVIRTGGERRLSNFLLWQAAYAELVFLNTAWPDFHGQNFLDCLKDFRGRERRFGKVPGQSGSSSRALRSPSRRRS